MISKPIPNNAIRNKKKDSIKHNIKTKNSIEITSNEKLKIDKKSKTDILDPLLIKMNKSVNFQSKLNIIHNEGLANVEINDKSQKLSDKITKPAFYKQTVAKKNINPKNTKNNKIRKKTKTYEYSSIHAYI